jgi:NAD+ kinase
MCSTVGLVSDDDVGTVGLREAVRGADADLRAGSAAGVLDADTDAVVALGERALVDLVAAGLDSDRPVLPVDAGASVRSVPRSAAPGAVEALLDGSWTPVELPLLSAQGADALFDFTLVTSEPARISEYTVVSGEERVATVRADAVVVTTPTGSPGYAKAADGPVLAPGTGVIGVVPVAPFATDADHWVLPDDAVRLVVERDEAPVELLADGRSVGTVPANEPIPIARERSLTVAVVEGSQRFFG